MPPGIAADRLDRPPLRTALTALPPGFGTRFAIFADAEEEFDWSRPFDRAATATTAIRALPEATARFAARGIVPTYLIDYPVATNPDSAPVIAALAASGRCDVGAQLHPWVTPPHIEPVNDRNSFVGNLPADLEDAKIAAITRAVTALIEAPPVAYRAGRYGVGPTTAQALRRHGYRLDSSVRSLFDYAPVGGPDFSHHPVVPWWLAGDIVAVPLTAAWVGPLRRAPVLRIPPVHRALARARLRNRIALTPEGVPAAAALRAIDLLFAQGHRLFNLSFHTPSIVPGHTPYVRDAADLRRFWRWWDVILDRFAQLGVAPVRAGEIVAAADAARLASAGVKPLFGGRGL